MLEPGYYFVEAWREQGATTNRMKDQCYLNSDQKSPLPAMHGVEPGMYSEDHVQSRINEALDKYKKEIEIAELRKDIQELQKNDSNEAIAGFLEKIKPWVGPIMTGLFGEKKMLPAAAAAGVLRPARAGRFSSRSISPGYGPR